MPVIAGFDKLSSVPEEQITDKIKRRVVSVTASALLEKMANIDRRALRVR